LSETARLVAELGTRAEKLGFDAFGICKADAAPELGQRLQLALANGWHGDMEWMATTATRRSAPKALWAEVRSILMFGINYGPDENPLDLLAEKSIGNISVYARNRDYHDLIKGRLKELANLLARRAGAEVKVFVDTAPVMEKPLAELAGLGWQGKHTVLVSRDFGSWLFLGAIFTTADLPATTSGNESCGTCTKCLDICPTKAFPAPFQLDARKCLAFLNNEAKGQIPRAYRAPMGNRIYGCDDCLAVCPWNKFAKATSEAKLQAREALSAPSLKSLLALDDAGFRTLFSGSPVKRLGHARFLRNVLIAAGNSGDATLCAPVETLLSAPDPLVRGAAVWAARRLAEHTGEGPWLDGLQKKHQASETDTDVKAEWQGDLTPPLEG
jgi:epoxyqueuosine reductase